MIRYPNPMIGILLLLAWAVFLSVLVGCASAPVVVGHCEIPQAYDYVATGPDDLPEVLTPPQKHLQDELAERHEHKTLADDFNGFHDYVKDKCNGA